MSIQLKNIKKSFKTNTVLNGVSLDVAKGETLVLFGPSGAGKTVLLRLIAGVIEPDAGQIAVNGRDMAGLEPEDRGIGMAFQNFALFPHMDAYDNIASPLTAKSETKSAMKQTVDKVARLLKIDHVLHHKPKELSNGQKQRTSLARALAGEPSVLLLDDPLRNVDAKLRFEMRLELPRLLGQQNATVIYVTQDYKEAMALGHRIAVIKDGAIQQIGTPAEIYLTPASTEIARLFGDPVINLLDVRPERHEGEVVARISERPLRLDPGYAARVGSDCVLGVRPESIRFVPAGTPGAIPVEVEAETPLNEKTVTLVLTAGGREILVSRPAGSAGPTDRQAFIAIDTQAAMLFDRATGNRIAPADAPARKEALA
ncbi:MAG: ABC transporter ATP-binding protein [Paracoccus sp. (in: a-proteobacteria)]|jgi:multiple sugar transport system ATP-binding protein